MARYVSSKIYWNWISKLILITLNLEGVLGGNLGLFLGASMVTLIEVIIFVFNRCRPTWKWKNLAYKPKQQHKF